MYRIKHKSGLYVKDKKLSRHGKIYRNRPAAMGPDYSVVNAVVLDEITVTLRQWHPSVIGDLWKLGLSDGQEYFYGYGLMDELVKAGLNVMLLNVQNQYHLFVDNRSFQIR